MSILEKQSSSVVLTRSLKPIHLWALAVGLVISGNYFGWSYGYGTGGPLGLLVACIPVTIFYGTFILCYSEMATAIPHAGGPSAYARRAFGPFMGHLAGFSCLVEFLFAPPAIAIAIGQYIHFMIPAVPAIAATVIAISVFVAINMIGMHTSAVFELIVTVIALLGLCLFWGAAIPHFNFDGITRWSYGNSTSELGLSFAGVMASVPFAIWFYLALEGGAMAAEEMVHPQKDIPKGFLSGMATLFVMMMLTCTLTAGIADYNLVKAVDFPLPIAMAQIFGEKGTITLLVNFIGLFGLVASLHGILMGSSRQLYAMSRTGYLPKFLSQLHHKYHTPYWALITSGVICLVTAITGLTAVVISISVIGSVALYFFSLLSFFKLRISEPTLKRPFKVSGGIAVASISMILCLFCLYSVLFYADYKLAVLCSLIIYALGILWYFVKGRKNIRPFEEEFGITL
ncbi:MAG: ethanolamine permease [Oligoflexia bacterium]|nr:ethanolamine permease [Oligoflexia bacterium]MBF0365215.1 ethanolamine permease [Oligoflexia bacterium]